MPGWRSGKRAKRRSRATPGSGDRSRVEVWTQQPHLGRLVEDMHPAFREWLIDFGSGGYVALYHFDAQKIAILAVRHQEEAGC